MRGIDGLKLTVLIEDTKRRPDLVAKHGLSFFIEVESARGSLHLLFDAGPEAEAVLDNARRLGVDLKKVDYIALSHGHSDHTGGLLGVLKFINKKLPIILHPEALEPKFVLKKKKPKKIGMPCTAAELESAGGILIRNKKPYQLVPGVWVSGEIKRTNRLEQVKGFRTKREGRLVKDNLPDDQALFVRVKGAGLLVITGCAHAGIVNTIESAQRMTGSSCLHAVLGGFHLYKSDTGRITWTAGKFKEFSVESLMPCHCTGSRAVAKFVSLFGKNCRRIRTGDSVTFGGPKNITEQIQSRQRPLTTFLSS
ncbi:MAG: MBL fold metallo-hydrolase [Candidatus Hadarchaeum sp.]|uniref:MBL fold metallo-hydrolase n=1 Tax=Candidatus Hadarchaeum sp. TaxID=2883567 RepID=UPI003D0FB4A7